MKKFFRIFILTFSILNMSVIYAHCETLSLIEEKLHQVGIPSEYSDNIINYIYNLKLSDKDAEDIVNLADGLKINIDLDLSNKEVVLKDKESKAILIKCDMSDVKKYYENYKESPLTSKDYEELKSYISENTITNSNDLKSNYDDNSSTKLNESDENNSIKNQQDKSNELAESSYNNKENNSEVLNSASAIKSKNANRVMSIVFLILFACVIISLLVDSLFFNKDN